MRNFVLNGVELQIPEDCLTEPLIAAIEAGRFEGQEAFALKKNLRAGDRVLDLGAGSGYLSALAADIVGAENVVAVEAVQRMIKPLRANLDGNFAVGTAVVYGAVVADSHVGETVNFRTRQAFWASEIVPESDEKSARLSAVPALKIGALLREHRPSVVILDIEGGEAMLQDTDWPDHVRLLIIELHIKKYGAGGVKRIFDGLSRSGLSYHPWGSRGELVVFARA